MNTENANKPSIDIKKRDFLCALSSILLSIILLVILNFIIFLFYRPDISEIVQQVASVSYYDKSWFAPEPVERMQFTISVLLLPVIVFLSYSALTKIARKSGLLKEKTDLFYLIGVLGTTAGTVFLLYFINMQNNFYYLKNTPVFEFFPIFTLLLFPGILLCTGVSEIKPSINRLFFIIFGICSIILTISLFLMTIFNKNRYYGGLAHFDAAFYSVSQVYGGKTLLVDFNNQYGLYPHFLEPVFRITGLTVLNYSIIMSLLTAISFALIFFFLTKTVSNNVVSFLGFTTVAFFCLLMMRLSSFDVYFQYWPIRVIFPVLFLVLAVLYFEKENRVIYYGISVLSSAAVLWNLDSGVIVVLTWGISLAYCELLKQDIRSAIKNSLYHILTILLIFCAVVICYILYIEIRSGHVPVFFDFVQYQQFFYISGFFMLPMNLFHPWNIIWVIYLCGLLSASKSFIYRENSSCAKIIFLLTILGFGLFSYYQGRSDDTVLLVVAYPAILLLTIFTGIFVSDLKKHGLRLYHNVLLVMVCIFLLSISVCGIGYHTNQYYQFSERGFSALNDTLPTNTTENIEFIKNSTRPGEKILLLGNNTDGMYYGESHTVSVLNTPGFAEILYMKDFNEPQSFLLNNSDVKVFVAITDHNPGLNEILIQNYSLKSISTSKQIALFYRNFSPLKNQSFFREGPDTIYHKISDTYIFPPEKIGLGNNFTIQILVKPSVNHSTKQLTREEILGNDPKTGNPEGFVIMQENLDQNEYSLHFGNGQSWERSVPVLLTEEEWNYLVITMENRTVSSYTNGSLVGTIDVSGSIRNSDMPLYVGNWYYFNNRPFDGTIKELMISNSSLSSETVKANWDSLQNRSFLH